MLRHRLMRCWCLLFLSLLCFLMTVQPRRFTLFPYTTLFRSPRGMRNGLPPAPAARIACCGGACARRRRSAAKIRRSEEHTSELQSRLHLVCRLLLEKKKKKQANADD